MIEVVGIAFKPNKKVYYFSPNGMKIKKGINVIVKTERGLQFGTVEIANTEIEESKIKSSLAEVIRIASKKDYEKHVKNVNDAKKALKNRAILLFAMVKAKDTALTYQDPDT